MYSFGTIIFISVQSFIFIIPFNTDSGEQKLLFCSPYNLFNIYCCLKLILGRVRSVTDKKDYLHVFPAGVAGASFEKLEQTLTSFASTKVLLLLKKLLNLIKESFSLSIILFA